MLAEWDEAAAAAETAILQKAQGMFFLGRRILGKRILGRRILRRRILGRRIPGRRIIGRQAYPSVMLSEWDEAAAAAETAILQKAQGGFPLGRRILGRRILGRRIRARCCPSGMRRRWRPLSSARP